MSEMSPITKPAELDPITTMLGRLDPAEHEQRRRIHACRELASYAVSLPHSPSARQLYWILCDMATAYLYAPADLPVLTDVAEFCRRLLLVADQADRLEAADELV
jgi:hypothetical protein